MELLAAWAPTLLGILGILIVWLAVLRYRSHQRKAERRRQAEWQQHHEWLKGGIKPKEKS
jgi:hypothetical protein